MSTVATHSPAASRQGLALGHAGPGLTLVLCPLSPLPPAVIVLAVLEGILLLLLIFLRQRIRIAIALLKEASKSEPI